MKVKIFLYIIAATLMLLSCTDHLDFDRDIPKPTHPDSTYVNHN